MGHSKEFVCPVCERTCPHAEVSRHHVLPKSQGGRMIEMICVDCHKQIHALFTVKELAHDYPTLEALRAAPAIQKWVGWVRRKPCHGLRRTS